jgi:hypothetical protein
MRLRVVRLLVVCRHRREEPHLSLLQQDVRAERHSDSVAVQPSMRFRLVDEQLDARVDYVVDFIVCLVGLQVVLPRVDVCEDVAGGYGDGGPDVHFSGGARIGPGRVRGDCWADAQCGCDADWVDGLEGQGESV